MPLTTLKQINNPHPATLPSGKGSYALLLRLNNHTQIQIGRLGQRPFAAGYYLYLGSALGSGGLAARLRRHLSVDKRPFWHIDYLRRHSDVVTIWYEESLIRREHEWAAAACQPPRRNHPAGRLRFIRLSLSGSPGLLLRNAAGRPPYPAPARKW
jgi:Uri superfamily endonuclease